MKSHAASRKRFRRNGAGKLKRAKGYRRHHAWAKTPKQGRQLRESAGFVRGDEKNIEKLLPY